VNITIEGSLLELIDMAAQQRGFSRSAFLAMAAKKEIYAPQHRRNCFAVMYSLKEDGPDQVAQQVQKLGWAAQIRQGAWLLVTESSHAHVAQILGESVSARDTLVIQGWEAVTWHASSQNAIILRAAIEHLEAP
jgi:exopolyphosphatase/pppGpp-phosphohydrolase